ERRLAPSAFAERRLRSRGRTYAKQRRKTRERPLFFRCECRAGFDRADARRDAISDRDPFRGRRACAFCAGEHCGVRVAWASLFGGQGRFELTQVLSIDAARRCRQEGPLMAGFYLSTVGKVLTWARAQSLWFTSTGGGCCADEVLNVMGCRYD